MVPITVRARVALVAFAALLAASTPSAAARLLSRARNHRTSLRGVRGVEKLALDPAALADLRARDHAVIPDFPLGRTRRADLHVARFEPLAPGARAEVMEAGGRRALPLPDEVYFTGTVAGEEDSRVLLIAGRDRVHGFVVSAGDVFPFGPDAMGGHRSYALRNADPTIHRPPGDFCTNDLAPALVNLPAAFAPMPAVAAAPGTLKLANLAIETDQELRAKFPNDQAALDYLTSLAAAASAIYERDVAVRLQLSYVRLWGAGMTDPWSATDTAGSLNELQAYWNDPTNSMAAIAGARTVVHFVSGKSVQGGIAYVNVLCNASYGYGVSQVFGSFDLSQPSQIWDVEVFSHELGHNFGSPHSHCYMPPIDECYNQETGCYSGPVVASRGTIMSYCHLLGGGLANIDLVFGNTVSTRIGQSVAAAACLATVPASTTTTVPTTSTSSSSTSSSTTVTSTSTSVTSTTQATTTSTSSITATTQPTTTSSSTPSTSSSTSTTLAVTSTSTSSSTSATTSTSSSTSTSHSTTSSTTSTTGTVSSSTATTTSSSTTTTTPSSTSGDADGDGVADGVDRCPGTPAGDLIDANGCSICPCDGPGGLAWRSRATYVGCVRAEAKRRLAARTFARRAVKGAVGAARRSSCARPGTTRCCVYGGPEDALGTCRITRAEACHAGGGRDTADLGSGSCLPSPCSR